jgi:hypothetical protein
MSTETCEWSGRDFKVGWKDLRKINFVKHTLNHILYWGAVLRN